MTSLWRAADALWGNLAEGDPRIAFRLLVFLAVGAGLFWRGFARWRRMRLIEDTPTSAIRSLALGRAEICGRSAGKSELRAPVTGTTCAYYRFEVAHGNAWNGWDVVKSEDSRGSPFRVEDETGSVLVDPRGAVVEVSCAYEEIGGQASTHAAFLNEYGIRAPGVLERLRFREWRIEVGRPLYVLGVAQEWSGLTRERSAQVGARLAALRSDAHAMAELDRDRDGRIDAQEWEVARQGALAAVRHAGEDRIALAADPCGRAPFYISDRDEKQVLTRHKRGALLEIAGGAALALTCWVGLLRNLGLI